MSKPLILPDAQDALLADPQHHALLYENEAVRVLDIRLGPGEVTSLHTHCWPGVLYLLQWSECVRRDAHGAVLMDSRTSTPPSEGSAFWSPAIAPHTLENVGQGELHLVGVELKSGG